jgi:hypothetical protein
MINDSFAHSYLKQSCLQVFLYTDSEALIFDAASALKTVCHQEPYYVVVPHAQMARSLKDTLQTLQGCTGFIKIGGATEIVGSLVGPELRVYDHTYLCLHVFDLLKKGDQGFEALLPKKGALVDVDLFNLADALADELLDLIDQGKREEVDQTVFETLRSYYPQYLFIDEALAQLKVHHKLMWVGFAPLPLGYLSAFQMPTTAFCLAPSSIFLGDVLTPKARLKLLQKQSHLKAVVGDEHPLLGSFTQRYRLFYNLCSDVLNVIETSFENSCALHKIQRSMYEGLSIEPVHQDDTIIIHQASTPYQEVMQALSFLQQMKLKEPLLSQKDILILCHDSATYEPLLNALGQSLKEPVSFSKGSKAHPLWQLIDKLCLSQTWDQDFFIEFVTRLSHLNKNSSCYSVFKELETLICEAHRGVLGPFSLSVLKGAVLRASIFDLDQGEIPYESNFINSSNFDDLEALVTKLDEMIQFVEVVNKIKTQRLSIRDWLIDLSKVFEHPFIKQVCPFEFYKILIKLHTKFLDSLVEIDLACFMQLASAYFSLKEDICGGCIEIMNIKQIPHRSYKVIVMLGMNPQSPKKSHQFLSPSPPLCDLFYYPLWTLQAQSALFMSYLEGYPDLSVVESHAWVQAMQSMLHTQRYTPCLDFLSFTPKSKEEFFPSEESLKALVSLQKSYQFDLAHIKSFLKDPQEFVKKHYLHIKDSSQLLNRDLSERQLLLYLLQQQINLGADHQVFLDDFKELVSEEKQEFYLRSSLVEKQDLLTSIKTLSPLELEYDNQLHLQLTGLCDPVLEAKVKKQLKKLEFLCLIQEVLKTDR